jgi:hypothetical protein
VGAGPITEKDRFFGRESETKEITEKLVDDTLRYLILYGYAGCGKTSIIQAGVIPKLNQTSSFHAVCIRLHNDPIKSILTALQQIEPVRPGNADPAQTSGHSRHRPGSNEDGITSSKVRAALRGLALETANAQARVNRKTGVRNTLVLFIDQFEEFFLHPPLGNDLEIANAFFKKVIDQDGFRDVKIVFCIRREFFDRMSFLDESVKDVFSKEARYRLGTFSRKTALEVILRSIQSDSVNIAKWSSGLVRRILRDLVIKGRQEEGIDDTVVLPAEMQIVCYMVQRYGISEAKEYPGKHTLIRAYVQDVVDSAPASAVEAKQVLLSLLDEDFQTRAKARTALQISERLGIAEGGGGAILAHQDRVQAVLEHFDNNHHLITRVERKESDGSKKVYFELSNDYLVKVILDVAGKEKTSKGESQDLLETYRMRVRNLPSFSIPIRECFYIRRHPPEKITPEDRQLLRKSETHFVLQLIKAVSLVSLVVLLVRLGTVRFDFSAHDSHGNYITSHRRITLKRGTSKFRPLFGSSDVLIDTGFEDDELQGDKQTEFSHGPLEWYLWPFNREHWKKTLDASLDVDRIADHLFSPIEHQKDFTGLITQLDPRSEKFSSFSVFRSALHVALIKLAQHHKDNRQELERLRNELIEVCKSGDAKVQEVVQSIPEAIDLLIKTN